MPRADNEVVSLAIIIMYSFTGLALTWYALAVFFTDKSELSHFEFKPSSPHFSMAQIEWKGVILNPSAMTDRTIVDLSHENLTELLIDLYGTLGFVELYQLWQCSQNYENIRESILWPLLFEKNKMFWSPRCQDLFDVLTELNSDFIQWSRERKLSSQDLMPLLALKDFTDFNITCAQFSEKQLSRNDGKKAIDLLVDLILLNTPVEKLETESENWAEHLYKIRNPMTLAKDKAASLDDTWPRYVQVQRQRTGDRLTHKMSITFNDNSDLKEKLARLNQKDITQ